VHFRSLWQAGLALELGEYLYAPLLPCTALKVSIFKKFMLFFSAYTNSYKQLLFFHRSSVKRKVILMGGKTYVISLPAPWIRRHGIKKGEELDLVEEERSVVIRTEHTKKLPSLKLNLDNADESLLVRTITTAYRLGYGELDLIFSSSVNNQRDQKKIKSLIVIQDTCDQLIGFEIIKQTDTSCYIKDVAGADINEFEQILRRMFLMLNSFGRESFDAIAVHDTNMLIELHRKHIVIRKFASYCQRYLNVKGTQGKTLLYHELVLGLLELSKTYRYMTKVQLAQKHRYAKEVLEAYHATVDLQERFAMLFYTYSVEDARSVIASRILILDKINALSEKVAGKDIILLHRLPVLLNTLYSLVSVTMALHFEDEIG